MGEGNVSNPHGSNYRGSEFGENSKFWNKRKNKRTMEDCAGAVDETRWLHYRLTSIIVTFPAATRFFYYFAPQGPGPLGLFSGHGGTRFISE